MIDSAENERALLASIVLCPAHLDQLAGVVSASDFADCHLGHFYDVVATGHDAELPMSDPKLLLAELRRNKVHPSVSNVAFVGRLMADGISAHALHYGRLVAKASRLRQQADLARELLELSDQHDADPESIAAWLEASLAGMSAGSLSSCRTIQEISAEYLAQLQSPESRDRIVMSGILSIDQTVGGWLPGELVILAARTSVGKTALATQIAMNVAARGKSVLFASLEMRDLELIGRILCGAAEVDSYRVRSGRHNDRDVANLQWAASKLSDHRLRVWSARQPKTSQIRANAKRVKAAEGLDLLIVDYIGFVRADDGRRDRHEQVGQITADLKGIAKEVGVPVMGLAQLNREADKGAPKLSHMRESGSIEQDADCALILHRENLEQSDTRLIVAKNRHGQVGAVPLVWNKSKTRFEDQPNYQEWQG